MITNSKNNKYPRGSQWRKWDLHIHSEHSKEKRAKLSVEDIFLGAMDNDIKVIAITDHSNVNNLDEAWDIFENKKVKVEGENRNISEFVNFFPAVELKASSGKRGVHFIAVFPRWIDDKKVDSKFLREELLAKINCSDNDIEKSGEGDYDKGLFEISVDIKKSSSSVRDLGGLVVVHAGTKSRSLEKEIEHHNDGADKYEILNSLGPEKKEIMEDYVDICEVPNWSSANQKEAKFYFETFNKPTVLFSDSHEKFDGEKFTWIKADPTFEGLRQILYEPDQRGKIQKRKPEEKASYSVIDKIIIQDKENFPEEILFNNNLCSIIGSRSSGKSALLSLLGYAVDSQEVTKAHQTVGLENQYVQGYTWEDAPEVKVLWQDETETFLSTDNNKNIIYIPQNYLFNGYQDVSKISRLIKPILFSKDEEQKSKKELLENYLVKIQQNIDTDINKLFDLLAEIEETRQEIKELGDSTEIKKEVKKLEKQKNELSDQSQVTKDDLEEYNDLATEVKDKKERIQVINNELPVLKQYTDSIEIRVVSLPEGISETSKEKIEKEITETTEQTKDSIKEFISQHIEDLENRKEEFEEQIKTKKEGNKDLIEKVKSARELEELLKQKAELEAKIEKTDKLQKKKNRLNEDIEEIMGKLETKLKEREQKVEDYTGDVDCEIDEDLKIKADVIRKKSKTTNSYFGLNFHNSNWNEKHKYWRSEHSGDNFLFDYDFFLESPKELIKAVLNADVTMLQGFDRKQTIQRLCTLVSKVEYVAEFEGDRVGGQEPSTMTPGKKALFALKMIIGESSDTWPLLIDQPEDNLDSRSIYDEVVPFLKKKKKERQIIMVSHDANLVVGADSEQVIVANRKGEDRPNKNGKTFNYKSGGLENVMPKDDAMAEKDVLKSQGVKEHVCKILEGGEEAFDKRRQKYNF